MTQNKHHEARWRSAVKEAKRIQQFLARGYLVMDGNQRVENLHIENGSIFERSGNCTSFWFRNDPEIDAGLYDTIRETRAKFRQWEIFKPVKRIPR